MSPIAPNAAFSLLRSASLPPSPWPVRWLSWLPATSAPFGYIYIRGTHVHHLVFGILLLLAVGFGWLMEVGNGSRSSSLLASRLMSLLYGIGAALTLDEFAIWLNLQEGVYWTRRDRASLDAVLLFGALLLIVLWGRDFLKAISRELLPFRRKKKSHSGAGSPQSVQPPSGKPHPHRPR